MSNTCSSRLVRAALAAGLAFPAVLALPFVPSFLISKAEAATQAPTLEQMKATLASYGRFVAHERYGDVWVPSVTPQGWHPYAPCHWVYTQRLGWYYDDPTPWGQIVHHYGRWAHDGSLGWIWVPGEEFSPGWVVWRAGETWTGWAPMPPQQDVQTISADAFNNDKHWIFVETKKLGSKCQGEIASVAPASQVPVLIERTRLVTQIRFVEGIAILVVPPPVVIPIVDIHIGIFAPWSPIVIGHVFWAWDWMWGGVPIVVSAAKTCPDMVPYPAKKLESLPPPPPPGTRADGGKPTPVVQRPPVTPPSVVERPRPTPPVIVTQPRPTPPVVVTRPRPDPRPPVVTRPWPERPVVTRPQPERPIVTQPTPGTPVVTRPRPERPIVTQPGPTNVKLREPVQGTRVVRPLSPRLQASPGQTLF